MVALFVVLVVVVKLMSAYIVAATGAGFCSLRPLFFGDFPGTLPILFWVGVDFTEHAIMSSGAYAPDVIYCVC